MVFWPARRGSSRHRLVPESLLRRRPPWRPPANGALLDFSAVLRSCSRRRRVRRYLCSDRCLRPDGTRGDDHPARLSDEGKVSALDRNRHRAFLHTCAVTQWRRSRRAPWWNYCRLRVHQVEPLRLFTLTEVAPIAQPRPAPTACQSGDNQAWFLENEG